MMPPDFLPLPPCQSLASGSLLAPPAWLLVLKGRDRPHSTEHGGLPESIKASQNDSLTTEPHSQAGAQGTLLLLTLVTWVVVEVDRVSAVAP